MRNNVYFCDISRVFSSHIDTLYDTMIRFGCIKQYRKKIFQTHTPFIESAATQYIFPILSLSIIYKITTFHPNKQDTLNHENKKRANPEQSASSASTSRAFIVWLEQLLHTPNGKEIDVF